MRILFLNPGGQLGGAELSLLDVMASLQAERGEWKLGLVASDDGPLAARATELGIETHVAPFPPAIAQLGDASAPRISFPLCAKLVSSAPLAWRYERNLARVIRTFAPDVLHTNGFKMHVLGALARGVKPVLWHVRDFVSGRPVIAHLLSYVANGSMFAIANSDAVADDFRKALRSRVGVQTVHNAIDLNQFCPVGPALDLDALSGLPQSVPVVRVGLIATMAFWKGHDTFLRALALLPAKLNVRGYIVGGRIYQTASKQRSLEELHSMAASLGISKRTGFTGHVSDTAAAIRSLDIVVHASTEPEPFGRVIVEAMACRRAVITSMAGGPAEIVTPEVDALTHVPGDPYSLAAAITRLAENEALRHKLADAALKHASSHFNRQRLAADLIPIYKKLAA
ncbi:MAG TPA: glycosyltransferase [Candidatus Saccharimonadales bacterium]|jgi:glycosyltransferase involved in cell wall biosynthesis|nr:glycosyltransferase [Candidatus Saccharimonadales bacterium]